MTKVLKEAMIQWGFHALHSRVIASVGMDKEKERFLKRVKEIEILEQEVKEDEESAMK